MDDNTLDRLEERATERGYRDRLIGIGLALSAGTRTEVIGVGSADEGATRGIDETTVFRIGSVTKLFTALAVMQLVERGLVSLDDPIARFLPDFAMETAWADPQAITVRHLLSHRGGVPGDRYRELSFGPTPPAGWHRRFAELPRELQGCHRTQPVGAPVAYSNLGYSLLALVVEAASGESISDYLRAHIFAPLGMEATTFYAEGSIASHLAEGNSRDELDVHAVDHIRDLAAGGLYASLGDMARFAAMIAHEGTLPAEVVGGAEAVTVLSGDLFREMATRQNGENPLDTDLPMGLGFRLEPIVEADDGVVLSHGGDIPPFHAYMVAVPAHSVAVFGVTHSNGGARTIAELTVEAAARLAGIKETARGGAVPRRGAEARPGAEARDGSAVRGGAPAGEVHTSTQRSTPRPQPGWREEELSTLPGVYASPFGVVAVQRVRRRLRARVFGSTVRLEPRGENEYALSYRMLGLIPVDTPALRRLRLVRREHEGTTHLSIFQGAVFWGLATQFEPVDIPPEWMARVGVYEIANPDSYCVIEQPEIIHVPSIPALMLRMHSLMNPVPLTFLLTFLSDSQARIAGLGHGLGDVLEVRYQEEGEVVQFSGYQLRKTKG